MKASDITMKLGGYLKKVDAGMFYSVSLKDFDCTEMTQLYVWAEILSVS